MHNSFFVPPEKSEFSQNNVTLTEDLSSSNVSRIYHQTKNDLSPETELIGENSLFGSETANNDLENDRNVSATEKESQHCHGCEILTTEVLASSEKMDIESNVLSQHCKND